jgi:cobalamin synthase
MSLGNALSHLTMLPFPSKKGIPLLHSVHYFPLIGAAMGSLAVLFFLWMRHMFPEPVACLLTVAALELLSGGGPLRGVAEWAQGRRTIPGHGFDSGFTLNLRGFVFPVLLVGLKMASLVMMPPEWRTHAVFVLPVIGHSAQTLAFVLSAFRFENPAARDLVTSRRCVRAGFWSATLMLLLFLFPWRAAVPALLLFAAIAVWGLRLLNMRSNGLTLQTVSFQSEFSEAAVMVLLVGMSRIV